MIREIVENLGMSVAIIAISMGYSVSIIALARVFIEITDWLWGRK